MSGGALQYVSFAYTSRRSVDPGYGWAASVYGMGPPDFNRQRRISGVFPGTAAENPGGRRLFSVACGWKENFYGARRKHANSVESGLHDCNGF